MTFTPNFLAGTMCPISCSAIERSNPNAKMRTPSAYNTAASFWSASRGNHPGTLACPCLSGFDFFDGTRAAQVGLVTAAVPATDLDARVDRYVGGLLRGAPGALAGAKALLRRTPPDDIGENLAELTGLSVSYFRSAEGLEGVAAYRQKRDPAWVVPD